MHVQNTSPIVDAVGARNRGVGVLPELPPSPGTSFPGPGGRLCRMLRMVGAGHGRGPLSRVVCGGQRGRWHGVECVGGGQTESVAHALGRRVVE